MATIILRPTGDTKADWTEDAVGTAFSKLDEAVTQPTAPTTGSDRITATGNGTTCTVSFATFTLGASEVVSVTLWVYGKAADASNYFTASILTPANRGGVSVTSASFGWASVTYYGGLTQAQVDALEASFLTVGGTGTREIDAAYLEVVTQNCPPNRIGGRRRFFRG